jgi:disulfide bond formation protein DsbB
MPRSRITFLAMALFCLGLILVALYMQEVMALYPCYLCLVQRCFVVATGVIALAAFVHNPGRKGTRVYGAVAAISALAGAGFAIRQLWLQSLPEDRVPACGPPADYLIDSFPLMEALPMLLRGDGNCAEVQWSLLGLSIPGWTLIAFAVLAGLALWQVFRTFR